METLKNLIDYLSKFILEKFTGKIILHFHEGNLSKKVDISKSEII